MDLFIQISDPMKSPKQVDVARIAGVSRAIFSYVLTGQANGRVTISLETKQRVLDAVAELGYVPEAQAQALHSNSTGAIGVIIPDIHISPFWQQQYIESNDLSARGSGYRVLVSSASLNPKQEQENRTTPYKQRCLANSIQY